MPEGTTNIIGSVADLVMLPTADAVPWKEARDGDYIVLRDTATRLQGELYIIDGVPTFRPDGTMSVHSARVLYDGCWMAVCTREFSHMCFQVWRWDWS